jgi:predicted nicotinamide N-methyase
MSRESYYAGPETVSTIAIAGHTIRLVRPTEPDRLLGEPGVAAENRRDDYMPYWAYLWDGAFLLAEAVAHEPWPRGTQALEIGCGLGLAGLAGLAVGLRVQFSDYDLTPLRYVERSCAANGFDPGSYATRPLDWRALPDERFPVILGSDVLYERRLVPLVVALIDRMLAPGGVALLAGPYRVATEDLPACLASAGLVSDARPIAATTDEGESVRGTLHRISRR